jgi:SMODS-associated and fused to various effectors sensor domain
MRDSVSDRAKPNERTKILVWANAGGRCTLCNELVTENLELGTVVPIGELAHNVGRTENSARGVSELEPSDRASADNLILLCRNCHKPVDDGGMRGRFTVEVLERMKREHEMRIRYLTGIGGERQAAVIRVVGPIRGTQPELTYDTVVEALTAHGYFPQFMPNAYRSEYEADLRSVAEPWTPAEFSSAAQQIDSLFVRVNEGIRLGAINRVAVFGFARIPVLVYLGSKLDDKITAIVFQRQRIDEGNPWLWTPDAEQAVSFETTLMRPGSRADKVALVLNISGEVPLPQVSCLGDTEYNVYVLRTIEPLIPIPTLIKSLATLVNFENATREFLALAEVHHRDAEFIDVFPAIPISCAVTLGRVLVPRVSPALRVYDLAEDGEYFMAMEVKR